MDKKMVAVESADGAERNARPRELAGDKRQKTDDFPCHRRFKRNDAITLLDAQARGAREGRDRLLRRHRADAIGLDDDVYQGTPRRDY